MPFRTTNYDPASGALTACVEFTVGSPGSYTIVFWKLDPDARLKREHGTFANPNDDCYPVPEGTDVIEVFATVADTSLSPHSQVHLILQQNGNEIDRVSKPENGGISVDQIYIVLQLQPEERA